MVRYGACPAVTCGSYYSNVARGKRKICDQDELIPSILEPDESSKERRENWSRLIQKIYEVDPLTCPKCSGEMKVISIIEDEEVIKKILKHLGLWDVKTRPPPKATCLRADTHRQAGPPTPHGQFPSQHHAPEFYLTYKGKFSILRSSKSVFLSTTIHREITNEKD